MIRGNHFYVTLISENRCNYRGFYRKSLLLPLAEGSVHTHTYLDAFYFIFREIPVNQTAFIFIKSYGIPNHSTRAPGTTGGIMWDTRGHWNMKMKGKKKEKRIETVTMDALPFNGCSPLFFFVEISKTTICLLCIVSNQNEERNIECWLEKYFTVNISFVLQNTYIQGLFYQPSVFQMYNFVEGMI